MRFFLSLAYLFFLCHVRSQHLRADSTPAIIRHLIASKSEVPVISANLKHFIPDELLPPLLRNEQHHLLKTSQHLYALVDGTGILFQLKDSAGLLYFRRIDKSHHYGNNYYARYFSLNDTIYSLGGYGFWQGNGQLRYFNARSGEWSLIKLNREMHVVNTTAWLHAKEGLLYCYGMQQINQAVKKPENFKENDSLAHLYVLNIRRGNWRLEGKMMKPFDQNAEKLTDQNMRLNIGYFNAAPYGHFLHLHFDHMYIDDFLQNKRLRPKKEFYTKISNFFKYEPQVFYFIDSTFYFGNITLNMADSLHFSRQDFESINEPVYEAIDSKNESTSIFQRNGMLLAGGIVIGFLLYSLTGRLRRSANKLHAQLQPVNQQQVTQYNLEATHTKPRIFDEIEIELIRFIAEQCKRNSSATVADINRMLGLSGKNESVQKKNRSEKLNRINYKWMSVSGKQTPLIVRYRSEWDKRSFEFKIDLDNATTAETYFT